MWRYKKLWKTLLIVHFAKDVPHPLNSAIIRLMGGYVVAIVLGWIVAQPIAKANLPPDLPATLLLTLVLLIGFIIGGFLLLVINTAQSGSQRGTAFQRVAKLAPLSKWCYWWIIITPSIVILGMIAVFGAMLIAKIAPQMGVSALQTDGVLLVGLLCGHGCTLLRSPSRLAHKGMLFMGVIILAGVLLDRLLTSYSPVAARVITTIVDVLLGVFLIGFVHAYRSGLRRANDEHNTQVRQLIPTILPMASWLTVKLWRNPRTRASFLLAITLSSISAFIIILRHKTFADPYQLLLLGALFATTFACDVRGAMRRHIPPELVLLKGAKGIVRSEIGTVIISGIMIGLPMFFALQSSTTNSLLFIVSFVSVQVFASLAGLFASTLFVPGAGDTGAQFFAAMVASATVFMLPKATHFSDISVAAQSLRWFVASFVAAMTIYIIELIRRHNYGRS